MKGPILMRRRVFLSGAFLTGAGVPLLAGCKAPLAVEGSGRFHLSISIGGQGVRDSRACRVGCAAGLAGA